MLLAMVRLDLNSKRGNEHFMCPESTKTALCVCVRGSALGVCICGLGGGDGEAIGKLPPT